MQQESGNEQSNGKAQIAPKTANFPKQACLACAAGVVDSEGRCADPQCPSRRGSS